MDKFFLLIMYANDITALLSATAKNIENEINVWIIDLSDKNIFLYCYIKLYIKCPLILRRYND